MANVTTTAIGDKLIIRLGNVSNPFILERNFSSCTAQSGSFIHRQSWDLTCLENSAWIDFSQYLSEAWNYWLAAVSALFLLALLLNLLIYATNHLIFQVRTVKSKKYHTAWLGDQGAEKDEEEDNSEDEAVPDH